MRTAVRLKDESVAAALNSPAIVLWQNPSWRVYSKVTVNLNNLCQKPVSLNAAVHRAKCKQKHAGILGVSMLTCWRPSVISSYKRIVHICFTLFLPRVLFPCAVLSLQPDICAIFFFFNYHTHAERCTCLLSTLTNATVSSPAMNLKLPH